LLLGDRTFISECNQILCPSQIDASLCQILVEVRLSHRMPSRAVLVVLPTLVVASCTLAADSACILVPRVLSMVAVALLTVRYLGKQCQAGNTLYVCFEVKKTTKKYVLLFSGLAFEYLRVNILELLGMNGLKRNFYPRS
jgi:hypothetical protein